MDSVGGALVVYLACFPLESITSFFESLRLGAGLLVAIMNRVAHPAGVFSNLSWEESIQTTLNICPWMICIEG